MMSSVHSIARKRLHKPFNDTIAEEADLGRFAERIIVTGDDELTDLQARGEISLTDGRSIPVWFNLADPFAPEVLAEKLQLKSSTILGEASAATWDLYPRLGKLGSRDIASAMLATST